MAANDAPVLGHNFTAGDLEPPISIDWEQSVVGFTSELVIDRPTTSVVVTGAIIDGPNGIIEYPWSAGDLVAGENQLVKARLIDGTSRRESTEYFKINVDEDIT